MKNTRQPISLMMVFIFLYLAVFAFLISRFVPSPQLQQKTSFLSPTKHQITNTPTTIPVSEKLSGKEEILSKLPYITQNIHINYLSEPDVFQVEILTTNIDLAKQEAVNWFLSQNFSKTMVCTYPVQFYLNTTIAEKLRPQNITFSPLAPEC